jgi:ABC-type glycerol-3-phosphate transport system substrate-binding protein
MLSNGGEIVPTLEAAGVPWLDQLGFMPYPVATIRSSYGGGVSWMIPKTAGADAAREFVRFMMEPANQVQSFWPYRTIVTATTDAARNDPTLVNDPLVQKFSDLLEQKAVVTGNATPCAGYHQVTPTSGLIETSEILSTTLQRILVDGVDPATAVSDATADLQQIVDDNA